MKVMRLGLLLLIIDLLLFFYFIKIFLASGIMPKESQIIGPQFTNVILETGINKLGYSNGVSWADFNNDGFDDPFLVGGREGSRLYLNNKGESFIDVTPKNLAQIKEASASVFADYDNDGCQDLFITGRFDPDYLFKGNCKGEFADVTKASGMARVPDMAPNFGAAWADYDNDGDLDLYIAFHGKNDPTKTVKIFRTNILYRNNGNRTFTDVTETAGVSGKTICAEITKSPFKAIEGGLKESYQTVWFDYNNDGYQDIFVANDFGISTFYRNNGDGTFVDVTASSGTCRRGSNMGVTIGDYNNDGFLDIYTTNSRENYLWKNHGNGMFTEVALETNSDNAGGIGWGTGFLDYDNDGHLDLYITNGSFRSPSNLFVIEYERTAITREDALLKNDGNGSFKDVSKEMGIEGDFSKLASGFSDFNNDGFIDIISVPNPVEDVPIRFYKNKGNKNNWISLKLLGTTSNRDSIGARITVVAGGQSQIREVQAGTSYLAQDSLTQTIGIGESGIINRIEIRWPSGRIKTLENIKPNQRIVIEEPI